MGPTLISDLSNNLLYSKTNKHSSTNTEVNDKYKLRVWIDKNVDASAWTKDTKNQYKFRIGLKSEKVKSLEYVYSNISGVSIGDSLDSISNNAEDYVSLGSTFFKHNLNENKIITSNELCLVDNSPLLCLDGGSSNHFEENKKILLDYYGESSCNVSSTEIKCYYTTLSTAAYSNDIVEHSRGHVKYIVTGLGETKKYFDSVEGSEN